MTSAPAIGFDYRPSRWPARVLAIGAALAIVAILLGGSAAWQQLVLAVATLGLVLSALRRWSRSAVAGVGMNGEAWIIYRADRSELPATLASFRIVGTCVLLRLKTLRRAEVLLLAPDNSDADLRRRLRMRLAAQNHDRP